MVRFETTLEINRPLEEVWAYVSDVTKVPEWNSIVQEATASETPMQVGTKVTSQIRFLGRHFEAHHEITEYIDKQRYTQKGDRPFPTTLSMIVEPSGQGTQLTMTAEMEPGGFFKLGEPILARITKKQLQAQLDTLKELLEAGVPAGVS